MLPNLKCKEVSQCVRQHIPEQRLYVPKLTLALAFVVVSRQSVSWHVQSGTPWLCYKYYRDPCLLKTVWSTPIGAS